MWFVPIVMRNIHWLIEPMNKILIIAPSWVGDMVMAQTLFKTLKQTQADAIIDVLAPAWTQPLLARMPEVNRGLVSPFGHGQLRLNHRYQLGRQMRSDHYDQAIVLPNSWKSAVLPWAAKIPKRTGWLGEQRWGLLNDSRRLNKSRYLLMIERFVALGLEPSANLPKDLPKPQFSISSVDVQQALEKYQLRKSNRPILVLCPGAEFGPSKRWPCEYFATVADTKLSEGWDVWLFGSPKDADIADDIQKATKQACCNLVGKTALSEALDLMSLATAVVTNDSGLMHIAAALERPQVIPFGSTSPKFTPPLSDKAKIISLNLDCSPCFKRECPLKHHRCMRDLLPERILSALAELQT